MNMQIKSIILYNHDGAVRQLDFKIGAVNIITGQTNTGKSAVIPIIEYCLGNSEFSVPGDVIRKTVAYYAVRYQIGDDEIFIAKPPPPENSRHQNRAIYLRNPEITPPPFARLIVNTNDEEIALRLNSLLYQVQDAQLSDIKSIKNAHYYLFQKSTTINHDSLLFHNQERESDNIRVTLPHFLGIFQKENVLLEQRVEEARLVRNRIKKRVSDEKRRVKDILARGDKLLHDARVANLVDEDVLVDEAAGILAYVEVLKSSLDVWQPNTMPPIINDNLSRLEAELDELTSEHFQVKLELGNLGIYQREAAGYTARVEDQRLRLQSINVITSQNPFEFADSNDVCPFCGSDFSDSGLDKPKVSAMRESLQKLDRDLEFIRYEQPEINSNIDNLKDQLKQQQLLIDRKQLEIATTLREMQPKNNLIQEIIDANSSIERLLGRIEFYLDIADSSNLFELESQKIVAEKEYAKLQQRISEQNIDETKRRILNDISEQMTTLSASLDFSYNGRFVLDIEDLTVIIETQDHKSVRMKEMGGSNYLGCHLVSLLSLHQQFIDKAEAVPNFLVLDQPAQGYFPSREAYEKSQDGDRQAVGKMFDFLFDVCSKRSPDMQIIVLEHANLLTNSKFQDALVNNETWFDGLGLIPQDWIDNLSSEIEQGALW